MDGTLSLLFSKAGSLFTMLVGDHSPWGPVLMEKPVSHTAGGSLAGLGRGHSFFWDMKNKHETRGALSIPAGVSCDLVLFPESPAVLCFSSLCVLLASETWREYQCPLHLGALPFPGKIHVFSLPLGFYYPTQVIWVKGIHWDSKWGNRTGDLKNRIHFSPKSSTHFFFCTEPFLSTFKHLKVYLKYHLK